MPKPPRVPLPHWDHCVGCQSTGNCSAYRRCFAYQREPKRYVLTASDLAERAFGWACLGFMIGVAAMRWAT